MAAVPGGPKPLQHQVRFLPLDIAVLVLALASAVILAAQHTVDLQAGEAQWLRWLDYAAIGIFGLLLVGKTLASGAPVRYARSHWFDLIGLLPLTTPLFGLERWWTLVGVFIVLARTSAALDRAFGERVLMRVFERYRAMLVEELTEPILVRLLVIIRQALAQGRYMESIGRSVEEKRPDIHEIVRKAVAASPKLTFANRMPGVEKFVRESVDESVTSAVTALTSDEMNNLVTDAITKAISDLEGELQKRQWKQRGLGLVDIARGFTRGNAR